jgi:hypothetical protein
MYLNDTYMFINVLSTGSEEYCGQSVQESRELTK